MKNKCYCFKLFFIILFDYVTRVLTFYFANLMLIFYKLETSMKWQNYKNYKNLINNKNIMTMYREWFDANITFAVYNNCRILTSDINHECGNDNPQK